MSGHPALAALSSITGRMSTQRPERYAKQLTSHWSARGPVSQEGPALVQRWDSGQVLVLTPADGYLQVEVGVPDDADVTGFAEVVAAHLERFGLREELAVVWDQGPSEDVS